jgi:hypothetical protein
MVELLKCLLEADAQAATDQKLSALATYTQALDQRLAEQQVQINALAANHGPDMIKVAFLCIVFLWIALGLAYAFHRVDRLEREVKTLSADCRRNESLLRKGTLEV